MNFIYWYAIYWTMRRGLVLRGLVFVSPSVLPPKRQWVVSEPVSQYICNMQKMNKENQQSDYRIWTQCCFGVILLNRGNNSFWSWILILFQIVAEVSSKSLGVAYPKGTRPCESDGPQIPKQHIQEPLLILCTRHCGVNKASTSNGEITRVGNEKIECSHLIQWTRRCRRLRRQSKLVW